MKFLAAIIVFQLFTSDCLSPSDEGKRQESLEGTRWEYVFQGTDPLLKDFIEFKEGNKYVFHSAEIDMTYMGVYFFQDDILNMIEVSPLEGNLKYTPSHEKAVIEEGKLRFISFEDAINGKWKKRDYIVPNAYYFTKVK